jgi:AraC-like DNA-binding protein
MAEHSLEDLLSTLEIHVHSVALCEIGGGIALTQAPAAEIVVHYVLEGEGWLEVEGSGPLRFAPGTVMIVPRGRRKRIGARRADAPRTEGEIEGEVDGEIDTAGSSRRREDGLLLVDATAGGPPAVRLVSDVLSPGHASSLGLFDNLLAPLVEDLADVDTARIAFEIVLAECADPRFGGRALIEAAVKQCLILALRRHYERHGAQSLLFAPYRDPRMVRIAGSIVLAPGDVYSIDGLAGAVGMSRSAFIKKFAECFGRSPMEFVAAVRLEAAARLLLTSALPVKAVASMVGFASRSHFSRAFRARYGIHPSSYRAGARPSRHSA